MSLDWQKYRIGNRKYDLRFNYFKRGSLENGICYRRTVKNWWKPFYWLGNKNWFKYLFGDKWTWFVRKHLTFD